MSFDLSAIEQTADRIRPFIVETPVHRWDTPFTRKTFGSETELFLKLELFQRTGTFKVRGAMSNALSFSPEELERGLTGVSAGNHAIAVAYAAHALGTTAKVVMPRTANSYRIESARAWGAEVVLVDDAVAAFAEVAVIQEREGRQFIHPFEGARTCLGTATLGAEFAAQVPGLDAVIVAVGGGGLFAGFSRATKLLNPSCRTYGVEPEGADNLRRALEAGEPIRLPRIATIADSLAPPSCAEFSFGLCREHLDELVVNTDEEMRRAMAMLVEEVKIAVEPAGAAAAAALFHIREKIEGQRVGVLVCGSNIDAATFAKLIGP
jgi:threonine dehydratase